MSRALFAATAIAALAAQPAFAGAKTSVQWGVDRTVSPNALCVYDGSNVCQPPLLNLGAAASGANSDITSLFDSPWFMFVGPDGTIQAEMGYATGASDHVRLIGGQRGAGGSIVATDDEPNNDVELQLTAQNNGGITFNNGWGHLLRVTSPGGNQTCAMLLTSGLSGITPPDISGCTANTPFTIGGNNVFTDDNLNTLYALNANPDFWLDRVGNGAVLTKTSGEVVDAWRTVNANAVAGKLSFQSTTVTVTGYTNAEQINAVAGGYSPGATDGFDFVTYLTGAEAAQLEYGNFNAQQMLYQVCVTSNGIGLPFTLPVYFNNFGAGGTVRSYVHSLSVTLAGWQCFHVIIPGDTTGSRWYGVNYPNYPSLANGIDLGSGSNFSTATLDAWQNGDFRTFSGAMELVGQTAGAYLQVTGVHVRLGSTLMASGPYQPLPWAQELAKANSHFYSTFAPRVTPAQAIGINTGEVQFSASVAGAGANFWSLQLPFTPNNGVNSSGSVTFFNPASANANVRDETAGADGGACTIKSWTPNLLTGVCTGAAGTAVGNILGVHVTVDSGM